MRRFNIDSYSASPLNDSLRPVNEALGKLKDTRVVDSLIESLKYDFESSTKALVQQKDSRAIEPLINHMGYTYDAICRRSYTRGILMDSSPEVKNRLIAANVLAELGEPQWLDIIKGNDSDFI
jgi:HEAT repeat protein